jgi:hypothetical protein
METAVSSKKCNASGKRKVIKKRSAKRDNKVTQFLWFEEVRNKEQEDHQDQDDPNDNVATSEDLISCDDDYDFSVHDFVSKSCSSASLNKKHKMKVNKLISKHELDKRAKKEDNMEHNGLERKSNINEALNKKGLIRFGFELYQRRAPNVTTSIAQNSTQRSQPNHSSNNHPHGDVKYELKKDNIPTGQEYLSNLIDLQHRELTPEDYELLLLLENSIAPKTVSSDVLEAIPSVRVEDLHLPDCDVCSICMESYTMCELVKKLKCEHVFHSNCVDQWLKYSSQNCPLDGLAIV